MNFHRHSNKFWDLLRGHKLIWNFLTPKREIEFWRIDIYNKLFTKESTPISSKEERKEEYRYKMQEFNVIYSLGELFYERIYGDDYREKFPFFLWVIEDFLNNHENKEKWAEGLNNLVALLIWDIQNLFKKDEKDDKIQWTIWDRIRRERKKTDEQKKSDLEHTLKIIFWEEILEKEEETESKNGKATYKSNAKAADIPPFWNFLNQVKVQVSKNLPLSKESEKEIELSPQRSIELIIKECYDIFFKGRVSDEKAEQELLKLKFAYALWKWKFQEVYRNGGDRYLEHLRETSLILLREKKDVSFDEIIIALLHDIIEDTDMDFRSIKFLFWEKISLAVSLISKKSPLEYIPEDDEENYEKKEELQKSWLLNGNNKIKTKYLKIYKQIKEEREKEKDTPLSSKQNIKKLQQELPPNWEELIEKYFKLYDNKGYKKTRNDEYFWHMKNLEEFKKYTKKSAKGLWCNLDEDDLEKVIENTLSAKFADRIHNLRTTEIKTDFSPKNIEKANKKIEETKKYFYTISEEFDKEYGTNFNKKIKKEVFHLEVFIARKKYKEKALSVFL